MFIFIKGGSAYDNPLNPTVFGSGGGNSGSLFGGSGGGSILITSFNITLLGSISANGLPGSSSSNNINNNINNTDYNNEMGPHSGAGGGSGGSISISSPYIYLSSSSSSITANGGDGGQALQGGGGGGGGCIIIKVNNTVMIDSVGTTYPTVTASGGITACQNTRSGGSVTTLCPQGFLIIIVF